MCDAGKNGYNSGIDIKKNKINFDNCGCDPRQDSSLRMIKMNS